MPHIRRHVLHVAGTAFAAAFVLCASGAEARTITLTDQKSISDAAIVNDAVGAVVRQVASCKGPAKACACSQRASLARLSNAYHSAVRKHPNWNEQGVVVQYFRRVDGHAVTVATMFPSLQRQLAMCNVS